jgi:hypothetical protein
MALLDNSESVIDVSNKLVFTERKSNLNIAPKVYHNDCQARPPQPRAVMTLRIVGPGLTLPNSDFLPVQQKLRGGNLQGIVPAKTTLFILHPTSTPDTRHLTRIQVSSGKMKN